MTTRTGVRPTTGTRGAVATRVALAPATALLLAPGPADADEALGRRLAALRALVEAGGDSAHGGTRASTTPGIAREAAASRVGRAPDVPVADPQEACDAGAWWRGSAYAARSRARDAVRDAAIRYALDPALLRAVIRVESAGNPRALSGAGAQGLMQLMPATARSLGVVCAFDPRENVLGGARYLRRMRDRLGSWPRALAAYHAGPGRVESGRPLPRSTRSYVARVLARWGR